MFNTDNRELALLAAMRPITEQAQGTTRDFANAPHCQDPRPLPPSSVQRP